MDDEVFIFLSFLILNLVVFFITLCIWKKYNRQLYYIIKRDHSKSPLVLNYTPRTYNNSLLIQHINSEYIYTNRLDNYEGDCVHNLSHIFGKKYPPIRNNEVKLYLKFLNSNARMLLICSITGKHLTDLAFVLYTPLMIYLAYIGQPWSFWSLSNIDFVENRYMVHTLYCTVWIYSIIIYFHILYLLTDYKVDNKSIATRAQLHTLMVTGLSKSLNDPLILYKHFDQIFPNQVISSHLIMDYTKRLLYENQLDRLLWQLRRLDLYYGIPRTVSRATTKENDVLNKSLQNCDIENYEGSIEILSPNDSSHIHELLEMPNLEEYNHEMYPERASINLHINIVSEKLRKIKELPVKKSVGIGFISFKDARCVYKSLTDNRILESKPNWRLEPAPHPNDIIWLNLRFTSMSIIIRAIVFNLFFLSFYIAITYTMASLNLLNTVNIGMSPLYKDNEERLVPKLATNNSNGEQVTRSFDTDTDTDGIRNATNTAKSHSKTKTGNPPSEGGSNVTTPNYEADIGKKKEYASMDTTFSDDNNNNNDEDEDEEDIKRIIKESTENTSNRMDSSDSNLSNIGNISFWRALLPPIIMGIINSVIHPYVITLISEYIGFHRKSAHQRYRLFGHIFYLITGTIFVPLLSSILALWQILNKNFKILSQYLGLVMSGASWAYAAIYILNATFISACNQLLQLSQMFCRWFSRTFFNYDYGNWDFDFGYWYAFHTSVLTLILLFRYVSVLI